MATRWSAASGECPESELFDALFAGELDAPLRQLLDAHVDDCEDCREFVAALARYDATQEIQQSQKGPPAPAAAPPGPAPPGAQLGRYRVLRRLGAGAMGVVHEGYDDSLERRVALKFINDKLAGSLDARARVFEEAKAMARVSHHNVAQVYEAAADEGRVFIVMEFVDGPTLSDWFRESAPAKSPEEILEVFIAAGRGLGAAHEAGVVHRDFKPDNVLLDATGQPKVVDFGLAGTTPMPSQRSLATRKSATTVSGVGTPLFMAPEVLAGTLATPSSDQFSFCVALHIALYGARPFRGATFLELETNVRGGKIRDVARDARVPARVRRAIHRGLGLRPEDRWPSMAALLAELRETTRARRRRQLWLAAGTIAVVGGALGAAAAQPPPSSCGSSADALVDVWDDPRRVTLASHIGNLELAYATRTADVAVTRLDAYAEHWIASRTVLCGLAETSTPSVVERRSDCLESARVALGATAEFLSISDASNADDLMGALDSLPSLDRCEDVEALLSDTAPPSDALRDRVSRVRERLATARAARGAGALDTSAAAFAQAEDFAADLDYPPLSPLLSIERGWMHHEAGAHPRAVEAFVAAFRMSIRSGQTHVATRAAAGAAKTFGFGLARTTEARIYGQIQRDLAERTHDRRQQVSAEVRLAQIESADGNLDAALERINAALALQADDPEADPLQTADILGTKGNILGESGELEAARVVLVESLGIDLEVLGSAHPRVAKGYLGLASALGALALFDDALDALRKSQAIFEASYPPDHIENTVVRQNIGAVFLGKRNFEAAERVFRELAVESKLPENHANAVRLHRNLAMALMGLERNSEAAQEAAIALRGCVQLRDADHHEVSTTKEVLAGALSRSGEKARAAELLDEAISSREKYFSADHPDILRAKIERAFLRELPAGLALAEEELRSILDALETSLGTDHPYATRAHEVLAIVLQRQGRFEDEEVEIRAGLEHAGSDAELKRLFEVRLAANLLNRARPSDAGRALDPSQIRAMSGSLRAEAEFTRARIDLALGDTEAATAFAQSALAYYKERSRKSPEPLVQVRKWLVTHGDTGVSSR